MKFFRLLPICVAAISFTAKSAYPAGEDLTLLDNDGTFICSSNADCVSLEGELQESKIHSSKLQNRSVNSTLIFNHSRPVMGSSISPKEIYINDTVKVTWYVSQSGESLPPFSRCKVMLNGREIASGSAFGSADFTADKDGLVEVQCKSGIYNLKRIHNFTVKLERPAPAVSITGPSGLHELQPGEFRWTIKNAQQCERFDSVTYQRVAIGAGNGSARLAWGGIPYQWVTVTIECTGLGGFGAADTNVYIIPPHVTNPVTPKIKSFIVRSSSAFKATGSWLTERMSSCNLSSNHRGSYNKMPVPVNTPIGGYAGLNTGGTTLEVFTLECFGEDGKTYKMNARPY